MRRFIQWLKDVLHIKNIRKNLDNALAEITVLREAATDLDTQLQEAQKKRDEYEKDAQDLKEQLRIEREGK